VAAALRTKTYPVVDLDHEDSSSEIDLNGMVSISFGLGKATLAAVEERDLYANDLADRVLRQEILRCMSVGQLTGTVGKYFKAKERASRMEHCRLTFLLKNQIIEI